MAEQRESEVVRLNLTLSKEAGAQLDRIMQRRFPARPRVLSLTVEQLIREENARIDEEERRRRKTAEN